MNSVGITEAETLVRLQPSPMRVLVKQTDEIIEQQKSTIIIPDKVKDNECARVGLVMAVGPIDQEVYPWTLKLGDMVLFHIHNGLPVKVDGDDFFLLSVDDVLGRFAPNDV